MPDAGFWVSAAAVLAGAFIQGTGGIGFAMFAAPIVALVRPDLVPGPMIFLGVCVSVLAALRESADIDYRGAAFAIAGRVPGAIVAGLVIGLLPRAVFAVIFALLILAAIVLSLTSWRVRATPTNLVVAGFSSGVMGTITSVGAPPMGIVLQNVDPPRLRATAGAFLVVGGIVSLVVLAFAGRFGWHEAGLGAALLLPMLIGFRISTPLMKRVKSAAMRRVVLAISAASALVLLAQNT